MNLRILILFACAVGLLPAETPSEAAFALYKAKQYPDARAAYAKIIAGDSRNAEAHYYLGMIAKRRSENDEAITQLEQATALAPTNSEYFLDLGDAYGTAAGKAGLFSQLSLARKCQAALEKSVQLDPNNLQARNGLVTYYRQAPSFVGGGMSKAYEQAAEIKKRDPVMGAHVYGALYVADKKYDDAFAVYEKLLETHPDNYLALYSIGRTAAEFDLKLDRGEQALRRCLELTPGKGEPSHAAVQWRLGILAEKRGDKSAAHAAYEASLKLDPGFKQAGDSLAKLK
ncbi:MAG: tetratricopeptide repeat protein [Opitutaceae bacterium]